MDTYFYDNLLFHGQIDKVQNELSNIDLGNEKNKIISKIYLLTIDLLMGKISKTYVQSTEILAGSLTLSPIDEFYFRVIRSWSLLRSSKPNITEKELINAEEVYKRIDSTDYSKSLKTWYTGLLLLKGENEWFKGNSKNALKLFSEALIMATDNESEFDKAQAYFLLGHVLGYIGDLKEAVEYLRKSLEIRRKFNNPLFISLTLNDLGLCLISGGNMPEALDTFSESLDLAKNLPNKYPETFALTEIGIIYLISGKHKKALENFKRVLKIAEKNNLRRPQSHALQEIGYYYRDNGMYKKAMGYLLKAYEIRKNVVDEYGRVNDKIRLSHSLFQIIMSYNQLNEVEKAQQFLNELIELDDRLDIKFVGFRRRLAEVLCVKKSFRLRDLVIAQNTLREIINENVGVYGNLIALAMINLVDLLLKEFRVLQENEIYLEINELLVKLTFIANKQTSIKLSCEIYILRARFATISTDFANVEKYLDLALSVTKDNQFPNLVKKIQNEKIKMVNKIETWKILEKDTGASDSHKLEFFELYLNEVKQMMERSK